MYLSILDFTSISRGSSHPSAKSNISINRDLNIRNQTPAHYHHSYLFTMSRFTFDPTRKAHPSDTQDVRKRFLVQRDRRQAQHLRVRLQRQQFLRLEVTKPPRSMRSANRSTPRPRPGPTTRSRVTPHRRPPGKIPWPPMPMLWRGTSCLVEDGRLRSAQNL